MKKSTQLTFYIFEATKLAHRIVKSKKETGPSSRMKKSVLERDYIRNHVVSDECYVIALRHDLATCYIRKMAGELYLDEDMLDWYPPAQNGAKPRSFYARKPPGTPVTIDSSSLAVLNSLDLDSTHSCPHCGIALDIKLRKFEK